MTKESEFRLYPYIHETLSKSGWDVRHPRRGGQTYAQNDFYGHDDLLTDALEHQAPEYVVLTRHSTGKSYWIIEAKAKHQDIDVAVSEAQGYADSINAVKPNVARFATGVAGSPEDSHLVSTFYWNGSAWRQVEINQYGATGFLLPSQCTDIIEQNDPEIKQYEVDVDLFLRKANEINQTLHDNEIPASSRAKVMAALLLALAQGDALSLHSEPIRLIREINGNVEDLLNKHGKEAFAKEVSLTLPATPKNHVKYRLGIVQTLQQLRDMNIRSAINSGDDALGKFYETFLKYANDAKEMGIVLTPRHITKFAAEVMRISHNDMVYDPTCGTGGFLVAALDYIRQRQIESPESYEGFRKENLFGIEVGDALYGLAVVNMIFRGDGKSNIYDGDCFQHEFWIRDGRVFYESPSTELPKQGAERPFSRVLMNPPFNLKKTPTDFLDYALRQMPIGGLCFCVLPTSVVTGSKKKKWRTELLKRHTVKAVIKFDKNLFKPVSQSTCGVIIESHVPHNINDEVFFGTLYDDNHRLQKSKLISEYEARDNTVEMTDAVRRFVQGALEGIDKPQEALTTTLDMGGKCDLDPLAYLNTSAPAQDFDIIERATALDRAKAMVNARRVSHSSAIPTFKLFPLRKFIKEDARASVPTLKEFPPGDTPIIGASQPNNGIAGWKDLPHSYILRDCITISILHNTKPCQAFWHPYEFGALSGKVHVIKPIDAFMQSEKLLVYLCQSITETNAWRYDYGRASQLNDLGVFLPVTSTGKVDCDHILAS